MAQPITELGLIVRNVLSQATFWDLLWQMTLAQGLPTACWTFLPGQPRRLLSRLSSFMFRLHHGMRALFASSKIPFWHLLLIGPRLTQCFGLFLFFGDFNYLSTFYHFQQTISIEVLNKCFNEFMNEWMAFWARFIDNETQIWCGLCQLYIPSFTRSLSLKCFELKILVIFKPEYSLWLTPVRAISLHFSCWLVSDSQHVFMRHL